MWHFADNEQAPPAGIDRMYKICDFINLLVMKFASARTPGEKLAVDETMIPFTGRLKFRQYIPGKAHRYGIKVLELVTLRRLHCQGRL